MSTSVIDDCPEATRHAVQVNATSDSFESGTSESGEPFTEQLVVQYYATGGTFADDVRIASDPGTKFAAGPASGAETNVYIVLRDNRGGVTWAERRVKTK